MFPGGYDRIIQNLAQGIDIKLQQKVSAIEYGDRGVSAQTDKGNFAADAAIITLPLGVLKSGNISFSPPLPKNKQRAIDRLNVGVLNKVALKFPKVFWQQNYDLLGYASAQAKVNSAGWNGRSPVLCVLERAFTVNIFKTAILFGARRQLFS